MKNLCKLLLSAVGFLFLLEGCNNSSNNTVESSYEQTAENRKAEILSLKNELLPQSRTIKKQDSLFLYHLNHFGNLQDIVKTIIPKQLMLILKVKMK